MLQVLQPEQLKGFLERGESNAGVRWVGQSISFRTAA